MLKNLLKTLFMALILCSIQPLCAAEELPFTIQQDENLVPDSEKTQLEQDNQFYHEFFKMLAMLSLVIMLLFLIMWGAKKFMNTRLEQMNSDSLVHIVEKRYLTPKTVLYVLEVLDKRVVIAESQNGITLITESVLK